MRVPIDRSIRTRSAARSSAAGCAIAAVLCYAGLAVPAHAQDALPSQKTDDGAAKDKDKDIIVTGTLIRGKAPTGGQLLTVTREDIATLGATDTSQLLGALPQDANFNSRPQVGSYGQYQAINTPLLRYLGGNASGSSSTLLLLDGVRLPGMGITQTSADIDAIAPGAIERVDIATDGGSATYGADAVGGVVNLITRKRFDGLEVGGHYGGADAYRQWDVSATAGKTWSNGSLWISYNYAQHNLVYNADRSYSKALNYTTTPYTPNSNQCAPGNYLAGGLTFISTPPYFTFLPITTYPIANGAPHTGAANLCDLSTSATFFPAEKRHSVISGLDVDLSPSITVNMKAYYTHRASMNDGGLASEAYSVAATYPGFPNGTVYGNLSPAFGNHVYGYTKLDTWGVTPKVTAKLWHDWQLVAFFNYGRGYNQFTSRGVDATALSNATASGAFNPFTGLFASNAAGQAAQTYQANYAGFSSGKDEIINGRAVIDGPLFPLPGGEVRVAAGGEILTENFTQRSGNAETNNFASILPHNAGRTVKSVFGELSIPIVGEDNHIPGFYSVTLSAAGRYDHYSDFGGTFDPKIGLSWKPTSWWTIRGNWSKSFQAPSLASTASAIPVTLNAVPASAFGGNPNSPYPQTGTTILLLYPGGGVGLRAQKATTWEIGTDIRPTVLPGLSVSATYYNIDFKDRIGTPSFFYTSFYTLYPNSYIMNSTANPLTSAQIAQYISAATPSSLIATNAAAYVANPGSVYALENALSQNLAITRTSGVDFSVNYQHPTSFGAVFAGVAGTYVLTYDSQATASSPIQGFDANNTIHLRTATTLGARVGTLLARASWNYTGGFAVAPSSANGNQARVGSFSTINLAFQYTPNMTGALQDITFNLNIDNILDTNPPVDNVAGAGGNGYFGFTLGRFIQLGIKKKF